ncbi:hypothetical protein AURDEDRAFT_111261 [Auricularia subglabra TFB-10046 SS5]|nr:hypothetical protein AURDEDRAFT_111261 [Auricularia subglabra TFB-10046 SS5]
MAGVLAVVARHRVVTYSVVSIGLLLGVIARAVERHSNFYSIAVDLSRNSRSVLILANFGVVVALFVGRIFQQLFFGSLRASELERLYDRVWFFLTESLLAWTIFRDELDTGFAIMFGFLLFAKCFHWLLADRIEWMDQVPHPGPNWLFHVRSNVLFIVLWGIDIVMLAFALESIVSVGMSGIVLFASEYAILLATLLNCIMKYLIIVHDIRRAARLGGETAPPWEDKSMFIFYVELVTDFLKLITYLTFFVLVLAFYGLPLNIVRDVFLTARSFLGRLRDLVRYREATRNMDERYPNATAEEMAAMNDRTCIICREEMVVRTATPPAPAEGQAPQDDAPAAAPGPAAATPAEDAQRVGPNDTPKKLPCGHVFHFHCLRSWLERQQSCPTCRRTVLDNNTPPVQANGNAPGVPGVAAAAGAPAPPQPGQAPRAPGAAADINQQLHHLQQLNQNIANMVQRLQRHQANLVPNQLQYGAPPPWPGVQFPPPAQGDNLAEALGLALPGGRPQPGQQEAPRTPAATPAATTPATPAAERPATAAAANGITDSPAPAPVPRTQQPTTQPPASNSGPAPPADAQAPSPVPTPTTPAPAAARPAHTPDLAVRNAALEAALRRINSAGQQAPSTPQAPARVSPAPGGPSRRPTNAIDPRSRHLSPNYADQRLRERMKQYAEAGGVNGASPTSPGAAAPSSPFTFNQHPQRAALPGAIPLYDPTNAHIPGYPLLSFQQALSTGYNGVPQAQYVRAPMPMPAPYAYAPVAAFRGVGMGLAELPPRLSNEQLVRLDVTTRDAIEERLRVLDTVQGTLQRCTDELLRLRSVLPAAPHVVPQAATPTSAPAQPNSPTTTVPGPTSISPPAPPTEAAPTPEAPAEAPPLGAAGPAFVPDHPPLRPVPTPPASAEKEKEPSTHPSPELRLPPRALAGLYADLRLAKTDEERARIQRAIDSVNASMGKGKGKEVIESDGGYASDVDGENDTS